MTVIPVLGKQQQQHRNGACFSATSRESDVTEPESCDDDDDGGRVDGGTQ